MPVPDPPLPLVASRADARRAGLSDGQISARVRSGRWVRLRRGVFLVDDITRPGMEAIARLVAAERATQREVAVSGAHAAVFWGLPTPLDGCGEPVLVCAEGQHRHRAGVRIVRTPLHEQDVVRRGALLLTSPARTVADCLRTLAPRDALAIADAAARSLVPVASFAAVLERQTGWPGIAQARHLPALVDARRESAFESWSALAFSENRLEMPLWQVDVRDARGFVGRGDAWWDLGVVGEADGKAKYRLRAAERGGADAERLAQILDEERLRAQRLRRAGLTVVRWAAADVLSPTRAAALSSHLADQLTARAGRSHTAHVAPHPLRLPF